MKTRQWSAWLAAVAVTGLAAAAFTSSGVSAEFRDSAGASASIQVGSLECGIEQSLDGDLDFTASATGSIDADISWSIYPQSDNGMGASLTELDGDRTEVSLAWPDVALGDSDITAIFTLTASCHEKGNPAGFSADAQKSILVTYEAPKPEARTLREPLPEPLPEPDPTCTTPQILEDGECVDPPAEQQEDPEPPPCDGTLDENGTCTPVPPAENCPEPDPDGNCVINDPEVTP